MHGRLKIKTTAEQEVEKTKERAAKQKLYLAGLNAVFAKRQAGSHDREALTLTAQLLVANPDVTTLWNFRREVLLAFQTTLGDPAQFRPLLLAELQTIDACLAKNPKSYGAWYHRLWVLRTCPEPPLQEELALCHKHLARDERNFHVWDHRRALLRLSSEERLEEELALTTDLISSNFSNYSAWHYRSKLLARIHSRDKDALKGRWPVPEEVFLKEMERVVSAVFTDPCDQSPWFYLRWLLNGGGNPGSQQRLAQVGLVPHDDKLDLALVWAQQPPPMPEVTVWHNGKCMAKSGYRTRCNGLIWTLPLPPQGNEDTLDNDEPTSTQHHIRICTPTSADVADFHFNCVRKPVFRLLEKDVLGTGGLTDKAKKTLSTIVDSCVQLDDLEPGNKWVLLSLVHLLATLGAPSTLDRTLAYITQLEEVDPLRVNYYKDLRSKLVFENHIRSSLLSSCEVNDLSVTCSEVSSRDLDLTLSCYDASDLCLTRLSAPQYLCFARKINLRGNSLRGASFGGNLSRAFLPSTRLVLDGEEEGEVKQV